MRLDKILRSASRGAMSCTPKRLAAFSLHFGSGRADIAEIAVAEGHQLIAHTDTSSPLRHDLTQAGEHCTDAGRRDPSLLLGPRAGYRCRHASRAQRRMKVLTPLRHGHDRSIAVVGRQHSDRKGCSRRHRLSLLRAAKSRAAVAQETLQNLARSPLWLRGRRH